jgi:hypothetical protein
MNQQDDFRNLQGGTANLDKLITWLEDIDKQIEARCALIGELYEEKLKASEHHYAVECSKIPTEILNSKILQASGKENSINKTRMECTFQGTNRTLHSCHRGRSRSATVTSPTLSTDSHLVTRGSSMNGRNRRSNSVTSTTRGIYWTSALKSTFASPPSLITPKVQPGVPLSMLRHPRQGELVFSMSGSPLVVTSTVCEERPNLNLRLSDGRVVSVLPESTLWPCDIPQVDEETRQLLNLQNHVDRLISQS